MAVAALLAYVDANGGAIHLPLDFTTGYHRVDPAGRRVALAAHAGTEEGLVDLFSEWSGFLQEVCLAVDPAHLEGVLQKVYDCGSPNPRVHAVYASFAAYVRAENTEARYHTNRA